MEARVTKVAKVFGGALESNAAPPSTSVFAIAVSLVPVN
jgi:hypothetical protein